MYFVKNFYHVQFSGSLEECLEYLKQRHGVTYWDRVCGRFPDGVELMRA